MNKSPLQPRNLCMLQYSWKFVCRFLGWISSCGQLYLGIIFFPLSTKLKRVKFLNPVTYVNDLDTQTEITIVLNTHTEIMTLHLNSKCMYS